MIVAGIYDNFEKKNEYISIDLSDKKHKNRNVDFLETRNMFTGDYEYKIKAQWTNDQYHPTMTMSEDDIIQFVEHLNKWVEKIYLRREESF